MIHVILTHEVRDFAEWKKVYEAGEPLRAKSGIKMTGVYTSVENPNQVTLTGECASIEVMNNFMSNPELKADMEKAGVISAPELKVLKKV